MRKISYNKIKEKSYKLFFGTLANKNRLRIINLLRRGEKNVTEICESLKFSQTMISHNLRRLKHCGFVFVKQKGKCRYYSLNKKTIKPLLEMIDTHMNEFCSKIVRGEK